jgi:hypothetical protein
MIKVEEKNYGFIEPEKIKPEDYIFGTIQGNPIVPDGQWNEWLPDFECQLNDYLDTQNCTGFGSTNMIEVYLRKVFGINENYSDRAVGINAGTHPPGNNPHTVLESIRKTGLVDEKELPFDVDSIEKYYSPNPLPSELKNKCVAWLDKYVLRHEWVDGTTEAMIEALKYSPLGVGVYAWAIDDDTFLYVRPKGRGDGHWCVIYGYEYGKFWKCFDSYDNSIKYLDWNFGFKWVKRIYIGQAIPKENVSMILSILQRILDILRGAFDSVGRVFGSVTTQEIAFSLNSIILTLTRIFMKRKEKEIIDSVPIQAFPKIEKYDWNSKEDVEKSIIKICKSDGLTDDETKIICAVIECESGFNPMAINKNKDKGGNITSIDYGLCQYNDYWYSQKMKLITTRGALYDPEKSVRLMIKRYRQGFLKDWVCYNTGKYRNFMV